MIRSLRTAIALTLLAVCTPGCSQQDAGEQDGSAGTSARADNPGGPPLDDAAQGAKAEATAPASTAAPESLAEQDAASAADNALPRDRAHCRRSEFGCLYDTQWRPSTPNTHLAALEADDGNGGAGCSGNDSKNRTVVTWEVGGPLYFRVGGTLHNVPPLGEESERVSRFNSDEWSVSIRPGAETAAFEETSVRKAKADFESAEGERFSVELALSCGA